MLLDTLRPASAPCPSRLRRSDAGFTFVEILVAIGVLMIMMVAAVPTVQSTVAYMRLRAAVASVNGTIQSTRYQAISSGYPFKVAFDQASRKLQISYDPTSSGTFTSYGNAAPFAGSGTPINLGTSTTLQFSPSGKVSFLAGASPLVLTYSGRTATITVSSYGNTNVKYTP